ncbi:MAG: hypothetical protein HFH62_03175 [Lachnospiraceae bacterium]|nr:hypothetical protein [Lachnospiraceae bacterium]
MQTSVKIMDIDVDMISNDVFIQKINDYLTNEKLQVIFFASTEMLNRATQKAEYRELIEMAELFLPGEEALLSAHHGEVLEAGDMVVSCRSFGLALEKLKKENRTIYIVSKSDPDVELLVSYCKEMQPELKIVGSCAYSDGMDDVAIVNEINSHVPDFLLVDLEVGVQEQWIMDHVSLLNAKLCVAIGGVAGLILSQQKKTPEWVERFHMGELYRKMVKEQYVKKGLRARIFRKKVVQYNNMTEEERGKSEK